MASIRPPRRFVLLTVVAAVACTSDPVTLCGCSPPPEAAFLHAG